jgi:hypothetical protein
MNDRDDLRSHMTTRESCAAFYATLEGGFSMIEPLTPRADAWLRAFVSEEATWSGPKLVVEQRYFPGLVDAIIDAGFMFERAALPN